MLTTVHCQHDDLFGGQAEVDRVRKTGHDRAARLAMHARKRQRVCENPFDKRVNRLCELGAETGAPGFVPSPDLQHFVFRLRPEDKAAGHRQPSNLRRTSDHGTAD